jgi:ABC-type sugar transport system ATPase subunit/ABC-type xylose transport system permease subunit
VRFELSAARRTGHWNHSLPEMKPGTTHLGGTADLVDGERFVLELHKISKTFFGVPAVKEVDLVVAPGEVVGVVGENGAGKSTLMKIVAGIYGADTFEGEIRINGVSRHFRNVRDAEAAGIVLVPQELFIADGLSVAENMFMGRLPGRSIFVDEDELRRQTIERLHFFGISVSPEAPAAVLSPSEQRLVTIASALAKSAQLIILDEPTAALTDAEAHQLFAHVQKVKKEGVGCLYISHRLDELEQIADRVVVMRNTRVVAQFKTAKGNYHQIVRAMIGRDPERAPQREVIPREEPILTLQSLQVYDPRSMTKKRAKDVSLTLHKGEILGLFGLVGAGRTELAQAIFGAWPGRIEGRMVIGEAEKRPASPREAIELGIGMLTENRKQTGLIEGQSVLSNISAASIERVSGRIFIDTIKEWRCNTELVQKLDVRPPNLNSPVQAFSGGNQQKILLARWLATNPRVLILDEPTFGVDIGARFEIYRLIRELASEGHAVLMISSDLNEVTEKCDRILVMYKGRLNGEFEQGADRHAVMAAATGEKHIEMKRDALVSGKDASPIPTKSPFPVSFLNRLARIADSRTLSLLLVFVLLSLCFNVASKNIFFSPRNLSLLLRQASIVAVAASGVSVLIIMGEIDLSIGSAVYLCSVVAAGMQAQFHFGTLETVFATILVGAILGAWQGLWVVCVSVPSFVVTLSGLLAFRGIGYWVSNAQTIAPVSKGFSYLSEGFIPKEISFVALAITFLLVVLLLLRTHQRESQRGASDLFRTVARILIATVSISFLAWIFGGFLGIPVALLWVAATGIILSILMMRAKFGRNAYLIGSNREASVLAGIPLHRQLFLGFVLMGVLYGLSGVLITARLGASTASSGLFLELDAIAGAVIGGISLRGGVGTVTGAMVGAVLLATIDNGMSILNVSAFLQMVVKGFVLLSALSVDSYMMKRRSS